MKLNTFKKGLNYRIDLSLTYLTLGGLIESTTEITSYLKELSLTAPGGHYLTSSTIVSLLETIPSIKKDFENNPNKRLNATKEIAYIVGGVSSLVLAYGFDGINFYLTLGLNLVKNTASTIIINKLEKLKQIDGVSCTIILGTLFSVFKFAKSLINKDFVTTALAIGSIASLLGINYKILKHTKTIPIFFTNGNEEKLELSVTNSYSTSILLCSVVERILKHFNIVGLLGTVAIGLATPIITFILSNDLYSYADKISEYLYKNEGIIIGQYPGECTKKYIKKVLKETNICYSLIGCLVFILSIQIISFFNLALSPVYLSLIINSILNVNNNIKSIKSIKRIKGFLN